MRNNSKRNFISKRPTAFIRVWSVIFSLFKTEEIIRSLSCKNPFCAIVKGLRLSKASEEQIPTAMSEETTKRVNYHKNGNLPLFYIEKDTRVGVLYAPFACVFVVDPRGVEPLSENPLGRLSSWAVCYEVLPGGAQTDTRHRDGSPFLDDRLKDETPMHLPC